MSDDDTTFELDTSGTGEEVTEEIVGGPSRQITYDVDQREFMTRLLCGKTDAADVDELYRQGFSPEIFDDTIRPKLEWVLGHYRKHRSVPDSRRMLSQFPGFAETCLVGTDEQAKLLDNPPKLTSIYASVKDGFMLRMVRLHLESAADKWDSPDVSADDLIQAINEQRRELVGFIAKGENQAVTLADAVPLVRQQYEEAKAGRAWGIPIPFPFLHQTLRGFQLGEVTTIVGRTGIGKTWAALMCACVALLGNPYLFTAAKKLGIKLPDNWDEVRRGNRRRVLLVSLEMPIQQIATRMAALLTKLSYPDIRRGRFRVDSQESAFFERLSQIEKSSWKVGENCLIIRATTPDEVAAFADFFRADLVIVDGFYLMAGRGDKRWERVQDNMAQMRVHSLMSDRHYLLVSQLAQKEDRLAFSQSIEQDSSTVIVLNQTPAEHNMRKLRISTKKVRDGTVGQEFFYSWDIDNARYEQEGERSQMFGEDT